MSNFTLDLSRFSEKAVKNAETVVKKIALDMHSRIVERSPVDTGRFRANNNIAVDANPGTTTESTGSPAVNVDGFKIGQTIFLFNNLEYAMALEMGHSKQAPGPGGIYRLSFNEVASNVGAYAVEVNT